MKCSEVSKRIVAYIDGEVGEKERRAIEIHLRQCPSCSEEFKELKQAVNAVTQLDERVEPDPNAWAKLQAKLSDERGEGEKVPLKRRILPGLSFPKVLYRPAAALVLILLVGVPVFLLRTSAPSIKMVSAPEVIGKLKIDHLHPLVTRCYPDKIIKVGEELKIGPLHKAILIFNNKHRLIINRDSILTVEKYVEGDKEEGYLVKLSQGEIWLDVKHNGKQFWVETETAKMKSLGTQFNVKVLEGKETLLTVIEGRVLLITSLEEIIVEAGHQATAKVNGAVSGSLIANVAQVTAWLSELEEEELAAPQRVLAREEIRRDGEPTLSKAQTAPDYESWKARRFSHLLCLKEALQHLGEKVDEEYLLNVSGDTFQFSFPRELSWESSIYLAEYTDETLKNASQAFGYSSSWAINENLDVTLEAIKEAVDSGHPLLTTGIRGKSRYLLVLNYQGSEVTLKEYGKTAESFPLPRYPWTANIHGSKQSVSSPLFILGDKEEDPDRREAIIQSLQQGIRFAKKQGDEEQSDYYHGFLAFEKWLQSYQERRTREEEETWRLAMMLFNSKAACYLKETRKMISNYLHPAAGEFEAEEGREHLEAAAQHYQQVSLLAEKIEAEFLSAIVNPILQERPWQKEPCDEMISLWD